MTPDVSTSEVKLHLVEFELISANKVLSQINQFMSVFIISSPALANSSGLNGLKSKKYFLEDEYVQLSSYSCLWCNIIE